MYKILLGVHKLITINLRILNVKIAIWKGLNWEKLTDSKMKDQWEEKWANVI